jgi:Cu-Zn family superoxide dismutase
MISRVRCHEGDDAMTSRERNDRLRAGAVLARTEILGDKWAAPLLGLLAASACLLLAATAVAGPGDRARAQMQNAEGESVGQVALEEMANGTLVTARLENMPPGVHAFHIHQTGRCEPPFTSAGGHYNPAFADHGFAAPGGPHAGDMPNIHVPASGKLTVEVFNPRVRVDDDLLDEGMDNRGASIVIHQGPDDYQTDPAGAAGPRIACGVLER